MSEHEFNFQDIVDAAQDVIIVTKADVIDAPGPEIVYVNSAFTELTGYSFEEAVGKNPRILQRPESGLEERSKIRQALEQKIPVRVTVKNFTKTGEQYWLDLRIHPLKNADGDVTHFVAIERDITEHKKREEELEELSRSDTLTGLLNRRGFDTVVEKEFARSIRSKSVFSLLMIDIDKFKLVNDTYGHPVGDKVLESIGDICRSFFRSLDIIARIGGEEFCILMLDTDELKAAKTAERFREVVADAQMIIENHPISVSISIGIAELNLADSDFQRVMARADKALYQAKHEGRNRVCRYHKQTFSLGYC